MQSDSFSASLCSELARLSSTIYERCAKKAPQRAERQIRLSGRSEAERQ